jgi:hypothetical protein
MANLPDYKNLTEAELISRHEAGDRSNELLHRLYLLAWERFHAPWEPRPSDWCFYRETTEAEEAMIARFQAENPHCNPDVIREEILREIEAFGF